MKPLFPRVGSKITMLGDILPLIPEHTIYVEPFFGSGAVFWQKQRAENNIINDIDSELIKSYQLIRDNTPDSIIDGFPENNFEVFKEFVKQDYDDVRHVSKFIIKLVHTFMALGFGNLYLDYRQSNSKRALNKIKTVGNYHNFLQGVTILNTNYLEIINQYDSPYTFFYLDPPYENQLKCYLNNVIDYQVLSERLSTIQGKFLLSVIDNPNMREIFKNFNIKSIIVKSQTAPRNKATHLRQELLIDNYLI